MWSVDIWKLTPTRRMIVDLIQISLKWIVASERDVMCLDGSRLPSLCVWFEYALFCVSMPCYTLQLALEWTAKNASFLGSFKRAKWYIRIGVEIPRRQTYDFESIFDP